jgi:phosphate/sulfate permease
LVVDSAGVVSSVATSPARSATSGGSVGRSAVDSAAALAAVFLVGVLAAAVFLAGARFEGAPTGSSGAPVVGPSIGAGLVGSLIRHAPRDSVTVSPGSPRWFHIGRHSSAA